MLSLIPSINPEAHAKGVVLDEQRLREVTDDDPELMREILTELVQDTSRQLSNLRDAIEQADGATAMRVAHYCKGACANVGADTSAELLLHIERSAARGDLDSCATGFRHLEGEWAKVRQYAARFRPN